MLARLPRLFAAQCLQTVNMRSNRVFLIDSPVMITEPIVMVPAPPIPLMARPKITTHIWDPRPLFLVKKNMLREHGENEPDDASCRKQKVCQQ